MLPPTFSRAGKQVGWTSLSHPPGLRWGHDGGQGGNPNYFLPSLTSETFKAWRESLSARGTEGQVWNIHTTFLFKKMNWMTAPHPHIPGWGEEEPQGGVGREPQGQYASPSQGGKTGLGPRAASRLKLRPFPCWNHWGLRASMRKGLGGVSWH